jgi:prepilin-type processing-associated H-X9-DG protein
LQGRVSKETKMGEGCLGGLLILLLPVIMAVIRLIRLLSPDAPGRRGTARELLGCFGWCIVWLVAWALVIAWFLPQLHPAGEAARRSQCSNNLRQIALSLQAYAEKYHCYPPAYTADAKGRPLHSWRVLLLPFMEHEGLYHEVNLDEAWDSPHNLQVFAPAAPQEKPEIRRMPSVFRCPSDPEAGPLTNYVMVVGPKSLSNGPKSVRPNEITDGASNTIAVVETCGLGIRWYEPRDLRVDEMSFKINDPDYASIASRHPGGANVGFVDASARFLGDTADPRTVEAATTVNGGEKVTLP